VVSAFGLIGRSRIITRIGQTGTSSIAFQNFRNIEKPTCSTLHLCKMTADATVDARSKNAAIEDNETPTITNRLFLSHIDYKNNDEENGLVGDDLSSEEVRQRLEELFSKFGSVLEIYLSDKEDPNMIKDKETARPPFGFVAMETAEEAQAALEEFGLQQQKQQQPVEGNPKSRQLFRDVTPAHVSKSKNNKQNKNERLRSERAKEYNSRSASISSANVICQVHSSHLDRLQEFSLTRSGVSLVSSFGAQKGTSLLFLRVEEDSTGSPPDQATDGGNCLERFSRSLWDTWFVAPNLNRVTLLNDSMRIDTNNKYDDYRHRVQGNIRTGVVPAIFRSLSEIESGTVSLRVEVFPPKLQRSLLEGLEDYNQKRKDDENDCCKNMDVQFSPGNPTHTISIVQVHPGVVVTPKSKGDNDKALYALGRLEVVSQTRKRSLSDGSSSSGDNKYHFQQQRTSQIPQLRTPIHGNDNDKTTAHNSNLKAIGSSTTPEDGNAEGGEDEKSISRAYWKLQEAWGRYKYDAPYLSENVPSDREPMWALDCGAAPGGWTKFLFRPGIVDRIYAVDPGKLSPLVVPGLDEANQSPSPIVRYVDTTIQKALPDLASELRDSKHRKNPFLDIWVSDMCVKDMEGQIDCFLQARSEGVVGPGTFFVLTLKCMLGYSATAFDQQTGKQVKRLEGISKDVHVVHLFSNRSSERTVIGYLI
jgi:RNA recognition motif-containing protein